MSTQIRISAKNLGDLALPSFCPRCFWLKVQLGNRLPFQIFPSIFSSIDSYTKRVIQGWFDRHGCPPSWLAGLGDVKGYKEPPHFSAFKVVDAESNILLTGGPDAIFVKGDGSHLIADYKTARYTDAQGALLPMYEVQLNSYALIGEQRGLKPVSELALIYMEPVTGVETACQDSSCHEKGFSMRFDAGIHKVALNIGMVPPLLAKVREIYESGSSPDGRAGCKDCEILMRLLNALTSE